MAPNIGISDDNRQAAAEILGRLLADEYVLYTKARNFHWNVVGPQFAQLHAFFEQQYEKLEAVIDEVAERVRSLGLPAPGTLAEFTKATRLTEQPGEHPAADVMIERLLADHEAIVREVRRDICTCAERLGDVGTSDFLTGVLEGHENMAWMLRAHLEGRRR
jgi:starvation-inducible DNA-binding protein